jgi:hypothetical protein
LGEIAVAGVLVVGAAPTLGKTFTGVVAAPISFGVIILAI